MTFASAVNSRKYGFLSSKISIIRCQQSRRRKKNFFFSWFQIPAPRTILSVTRESPKITCSSRRGGRVFFPLQTSQVRNLPPFLTTKYCLLMQGSCSLTYSRQIYWKLCIRTRGATNLLPNLKIAPKTYQKRGKAFPQKKDKNGFSTCGNMDKGFLSIIGTHISMKFHLFSHDPRK